MPEPARLRLTWPQVAAWRAARHHLDARVPRRRRLEVVSELCGLHAQVTSSADLTVWSRVEGWRPADLDRALWKDRTLVKLWLMRGTLHLVPSAEHALWTSALRTSTASLGDRWARFLQVPRSEIDRLLETIVEALDGTSLTREELAVEVTRRRRDPALGEALRHSWGGLLKPASYRGLLCFAPGDGQRVRFTSPRSWLGLDGSDAPDPEEALREVVRRFVTTYGPAPTDEVARWWGESTRTIARVLRSLAGEVVEVDVDGMPAWATRDVVRRIARHEPAGSVRLLAGFDQYVIGSTKHSARLLPAGADRDRVHRRAGWVSPVLAVDGMLEGVWSWIRKGPRVLVTIEPFRPQPRRVRREAEAEAERLATHLGGALDLAWS